MNDNLVLYTFVALVLFYLMLEVYKYKLYLKGVIVAIDDVCGLPIFNQIKVRLPDGQIIQAQVDPCVACQGQFSVGDEVNLIKSQDQYRVHLSFGRRKNQTCH